MVKLFVPISWIALLLLICSYLYCCYSIGLMGEGRTVSAVSGECLID